MRLSIANSLDILSGVVASSPIGEGGAGPVTVTTDRLTMNSGVIGTPAGRQTGNVPVRGASNATNVVANSSILLTNGALILSSSFGDADAGPLTVTSQGSITISDGARISADTSGTGAGGKVFVRAAELSLLGGGKVTSTTTGKGEGGSVTVTANTVAVDGGRSSGDDFLATGVFASAETGSTGDAGSIGIKTTGAVELSDGGKSSARPSGRATAAPSR